MTKTWTMLVGAGLVATALLAEAQTDARQALIARAKSLELNTPYVPPPGDPLEHYASGYAKIMCSAVFVTGLDPAFAAENVGYFTAPYAERAKLGTPRIDREKRTVEVTMPNGTARVARQVGSQGCVTLPIGKTDVFFTPSIVKSALPDPKTQPWPMGDLLPASAPPAGVDMAKVQAAVEAAFDPAGMTAAFVVTHKGRIIAERYGDRITPTTALESWSMGKSLSGTLMGILIKQGAYTLEQPAPIPEWQTPGDPRAKIRIVDILHMSSGLRIIAPQDPDFDARGPYPDHLYLYTGGVDSFKYAATRPQQWPPNTVGRYRNTDPVLTNYMIRLAVEKRREDYHSFPQRALFDKIGIRAMVRIGPRLGAPREPLSAGRDVERGAHLAGGLREVREHPRARVEGGWAAGLWRPLLAEWREHIPCTEGGVLHVRCRRTDRPDDSVPSARHRPPWALQGRRPWRSCAAGGGRHPGGSRSARVTSNGQSRHEPLEELRRRVPVR